MTVGWLAHDWRAGFRLIKWPQYFDWKRMKAVWFFFSALLVLPLALAEDDLPGDVRRVSEQRDVAIQRINDTYVQELEKLKLSHTKQGNLEVANKIVKMIEKIKADNPKPDSFIGKWATGFGLCELKADGDATLNGAQAGSWSVNGSSLLVQWSDGNSVSLNLTTVDGVMEGKNKQGQSRRWTKLK